MKQRENLALRGSKILASEHEVENGGLENRGVEIEERVLDDHDGCQWEGRRRPVESRGG